MKLVSIMTQKKRRRTMKVRIESKLGGEREFVCKKIYYDMKGWLHMNDQYYDIHSIKKLIIEEDDECK
jgi:hypothetical protein